MAQQDHIEDGAWTSDESLHRRSESRSQGGREGGRVPPRMMAAYCYCICVFVSQKIRPHLVVILIP